MTRNERERKGSFFTPKIWVELSQKYIADALGENWQDEYYVWDCAAGTGNLLAGLANKNNLWASTLDKQDVDVMRDRIANGANLWKNQVFQFDFLNDEFLPVSKGGKLPEELFKIISDESKRKKLVVYINPPYADSNTVLTNVNRRVGNNLTKTREKYIEQIGSSARELFAQFLVRIYCEIPDAKVAHFSKLKTLLSSNFSAFREIFLAKLEKLFIVPSDTFDNVKGHFPIGFFIWDTAKKERFKRIQADVYDGDAKKQGKKKIAAPPAININDWFRHYWKDIPHADLGYMNAHSPDFQNNNYVWISCKPEKNTAKPIVVQNLMAVCVYFAVRKSIPADWLNDRDQFLHPNKKWEKDAEFQNDCLAFTLFHGSNRIATKDGVNHWIPFVEEEVGAQEKFESHCMSSFINGKIRHNGYVSLFDHYEEALHTKREFSEEAQAVFRAGRELWIYYFQKAGAEFSGINVNASLYDIKEFFQGRSEKTGRMNSKATDEKYNAHIGSLRDALKTLAEKITPKIYEYGFLKR